MCLSPKFVYNKYYLCLKVIMSENKDTCGILNLGNIPAWYISWTVFDILYSNMSVFGQLLTTKIKLEFFTFSHLANFYIFGQLLLYL